MVWEHESQEYHMHVVTVDQDKATQVCGAHNACRGLFMIARITYFDTYLS